MLVPNHCCHFQIRIGAFAVGVNLLSSDDKTRCRGGDQTAVQRPGLGGQRFTHLLERSRLLRPEFHGFGVCFLFTRARRDSVAVLGGPAMKPLPKPKPTNEMFGQKVKTPS